MAPALMPNTLKVVEPSGLVISRRPQPDSSAAWPTISLAGTPEAREAAMAGPASRLTKLLMCSGESSGNWPSCDWPFCCQSAWPWYWRTPAVGFHALPGSTVPIGGGPSASVAPRLSSRAAIWASCWRPPTPGAAMVSGSCVPVARASWRIITSARPMPREDSCCESCWSIIDM
ncbi:hypothetical protein D3C81_1325980 [compost metagenome]